MALCVNTYCPLGYNGTVCYHLLSPGLQWHCVLTLTVPWNMTALSVNTYCPLGYNGTEC